MIGWSRLVNVAAALYLGAASIVSVVVAVALLRGEPLPALGANAPPPYRDGDFQTAVVNALGAIGRTEGENLVVGNGSTLDLLDEATTIQPELTPANLTVIRTYTAMLVTDPGAGGGVCIRLGPAVDGGSVPENPDNAPALACGDTTTDSVINGGCYLFAAGQTCTFTVRPLQSGCADFGSCHLPLWARTSAAAGDVTIALGLAW